jgi:Domain of unknown function DUF29
MTAPDYETDFYAWMQQQAQALRAHDWAALDIEHLAEEVADLWKWDRHNLDLLLLGLLEFTYGACRHDLGMYYWQSAVVDHHWGMLDDSLEDSPRLVPFLRDRVDQAYAWARGKLLTRRIPPSMMPPPTCPWTFEQLLDERLWPPEAPARLP